MIDALTFDKRKKLDKIAPEKINPNIFSRSTTRRIREIKIRLLAHMLLNSPEKLDFRDDCRAGAKLCRAAGRTAGCTALTASCGAKPVASSAPRETARCYSSAAPPPQPCASRARRSSVPNGLPSQKIGPPSRFILICVEEVFRCFLVLHPHRLLRFSAQVHEEIPRLLHPSADVHETCGENRPAFLRELGRAGHPLLCELLCFAHEGFAKQPVLDSALASGHVIRALTKGRHDLCALLLERRSLLNLARDLVKIHDAQTAPPAPTGYKDIKARCKRRDDEESTTHLALTATDVSLE